MNRILSYWIWMVLAFLLAGCAEKTVNSSIQDPAKAQQIRINASTQDDVRSLLGEPQSVTQRRDGSEEWIYTASTTTYNEKYAAKYAARTALSFVSVPYLGTAVGLADRAIDVGPDKYVQTTNLTLLFDRRGVLRERKRETKAQ